MVDYVPTNLPMYDCPPTLVNDQPTRQLPPCDQRGSSTNVSSASDLPPDLLIFLDDQIAYMLCHHTPHKSIHMLDLDEEASRR